jgi:hypothetical protein
MSVIETETGQRVAVTSRETEASDSLKEALRAVINSTDELTKAINDLPAGALRPRVSSGSRR